MNDLTVLKAKCYNDGRWGCHDLRAVTSHWFVDYSLERKSSRSSLTTSQAIASSLASFFRIPSIQISPYLRLNNPVTYQAKRSLAPTRPVSDRHPRNIRGHQHHSDWRWLCNLYEYFHCLTETARKCYGGGTNVHADRIGARLVTMSGLQARQQDAFFSFALIIFPSATKHGGRL